jgi:D-inositol-3-phosphate glycosyltransferase
VTPRKPRECAEAVSAVLRDSFLRRSLGLAGRDRACARYSWDRVAADTLRIYDRLVAADVMHPAPPSDLGRATV